MNQKALIAMNMRVLDTLRQHAKKAHNGELLEISQTIQLIRYDNEKLMIQLLNQKGLLCRLIGWMRKSS